VAFEGENPTRRYKHFHPRQAKRGGFPTSAATNYATGALFNDSPNQLLILRLVLLGTQGSDFMVSGMHDGRLAGTPGSVGNYVPSLGNLPGLVDFSDQAAALSYDFPLYDAAIDSAPELKPTWPLAVIEPGWSFFVQATSTGDSIYASFIWEAIYPEELDYTWSFE
jgi:hypothetical protein